ncbi:RNA polymerase sigma-70 factor [Ktedonobacter racemifer]|uniref:RNA polymerase, sigma-24 subunit, ECF subfamily n=1 Tax=Ktedonobacter racemifer DSM 44963 TaxID=485913 RepID=D6U1G8_KTERA|nr:RNA polymerase sigma-70 factor [Ktedonobacter racemifer]EFH82612.1 RNA polymerase, sigma-24 subunit, ECF subfamily [Ktedonobacter racemifer DSM 44963]
MSRVDIRVNVLEQSAQAFNQYRGLLFALAYRMLGSGTDAEDIVQEAFVRWLQAGDERVQSPKAYLSTIVIRLCINQAESARAQREVYVGSWLPEPILTSHHIEMAETAIKSESLSFAFLLLLQRLGPLERAVFLLREVFEFDYAEIVEIVDKSEANCRQILHRAHQHLDQHRKRFDVSCEQQTRLTELFLRASTSGDMQGLLNLLKEDVVFVGDGGGKVPIALKPVHGPDKVARGTTGGRRFFSPEIQARIEEVNGQPAIIGYLHGHPCGVMMCEVEGERICQIYGVVNPEKLHWLSTSSGLSVFC